MNKRANFYLNIYGFISFLIGITCIGLSLTLQELSFQISPILTNITFIIGTIFGLLSISIEVILFLLLQGKYKLFDILFRFIMVVSSVYINTIFQFSVFLIIPVMILIKDLFRIAKVDKIYLPKRFKRYCKMFNIKIKDFPKKRISIKENSTVVIPSTKRGKEKTTKNHIKKGIPIEN